MKLADPEKSYALLIGSSAYRDPGLDDLPTVANNLTRLSELLMDHEVWGLAEEHCIRVPEPQTPAEFLDPIHEAARAATDTLFVYFAGHGLIHPTEFDRLLLALPTTDPGRVYTAVDFAAVRAEMRACSPHVKRLVILDCCYSGRAFGGGMNDSTADVVLTEQARIGGAYLLTACAATRLALAPPDEKYTAFTGELIALLECGLPDNTPVLEVTAAYEHLCREMRAKNRPVPQQRLDNSERSLVLARNRYRPSPPASEVSAPQRTHPPAGLPLRSAKLKVPAGLNVPTEWEELLRSSPKAVIDAVARMESAGRTEEAQELLLFLSKSRPVQEVAMLVVLLNDRERPRTAVPRLSHILRQQPYLPGMTDVVVHRGPAAAVEYVEALDVLNEARKEIHRACREAAVSLDVDNVAQTVTLLEAAGLHSQAGEIIRQAATDPQATARVVPLAGALWSARMDAEADQLLRLVTADSPERAMELADEMLALGRHKKAFELYLKAAEVIARRPASEPTRVLSAMDQAGDADLAEPFLQAVVAAALSPQTIFHLCEELTAVGMTDRVLIVLGEAATRLPVDDSLDLADRLWKDGRTESTVHLLNAAAQAHPIGTTTHQFADLLMDFGRPTDGIRLLTGVLHRSTPDATLLLASLWRSQRHKDVDRLLATLDRQGWRRRPIYRELLTASDTDEGLRTQVARMPHLIAFLRELRDYKDSKALVALLKSVASNRPAFCLRLIQLLTQAKLETEAVVLACLNPGLNNAPPLTERVQKLLSGPWSDMELHAYALAALSAVGQEQAVSESLIGYPRGQRVSEVVKFLEVLDQQGLTSCALAVIRQVTKEECFDPLVRRLSWAQLPHYAKLAIRNCPARGETQRRGLSHTHVQWLLDSSRPRTSVPDPNC